MSLKKAVVISVVAVVATALLIGGCWFVWQKNKPKAPSSEPTTEVTNTPASQDTNTTTPPVVTPTTPVTTWPVQLSMAEAAAITVDVNKKHKLPDTYVPAGLTTYKGVQLRNEAALALMDLTNAAEANGNSLKPISGYRSFASQTTVYNNYVAQDGKAQADTYSARPGFSEHQTGLAVDVGNGTCDLEICFGNTAAGKWIAANAQNYGFIIRYPQGKEADTGYQYEPWHLRYLGIDTAKAIYASGKTMDQYYNIAAGGYE